jgi:hypothetical protein
MPAQRISVFGGEAPKVTPRLLGEAQAQAAVNLRLTSGRIDPVYYPLEVSAVLRSGAIKSIYRMYDSGGQDYWLNWTSDVDVAKGPIAGDTSFRIYFTSDAFEPRVTNLPLAISSAPYPTAWYVLGVTPPTSAPTCTPSGGSGAQEARSWVYTFVTQWGEESAPSPASAVTTTFVNAAWDLTLPDVAPPNTYTISAASWSGGALTLTVGSTFGLRAGEYVTLSGLAPAALNASWRVASVPGTTSFTIAMGNPGTITDAVGTATRDAPHNTTSMMKRLYRAVTAAGTTQYYFIKEVSVATTSVADDVGSNIGEPLETSEWSMPPVGLQNIRTLPGGAMVGFTGNRVCFSEPLAPYAWPESYQLITEHDIVGVGVFGTSVIVVTRGFPYIATGVDPAAMSMSKVDQHWPGLSKRGIVSIIGGVVWPTTLGLAMVSDSGAQIVTGPFYSKLEWERLNPASFIGAVIDDRYYAGYSVDDQNFGIFIYDGRGLLTYRASLLLTGTYTDASTGNLYVIHDNVIKLWDADEYSRLPFEWWSREFVVSTPVSLGAARVEGEFDISLAELTAFNAAAAAQLSLNEGYITAGTTGSMNGNSLNAFSMNGSEVIPAYLLGDGSVRGVTFMLYVNSEFYASQTVYASRTFRLPAGQKYDRFSIRLLGNVPVDAVLVGDTTDALRTA